MFPLRDDQPRRNRPVITLALIAFNVLVFLYQLGLDEREMFELLARAALFPARLSAALNGGPPLELVDAAGTLVTSQFLHGGFFHVLVNLWALWIFGDNVEDRLGPLRYLGFYVLCGVAAGLLHVAWQPNSTLPTVGASGAIAGVMGAYVVMYPRARVVTLIPVLFYPVFLNLPAVVYLGLWFALQLLSGLLEPAHVARGGGVAWWAHIGGFAAGVALVPLLRSRRRRSA
jgi:membrane associated rhomboid family serine protease